MSLLNKAKGNNGNGGQEKPPLSAQNMANQSNKPISAGDKVVQPTLKPSEGHMRQDGSDAIITDRVKSVAGAAEVASASRDKDVDFIYSCPHSEQYSIQLSSGEIRAKDGVLRVNQQQHNEIQGLIKKGRPDIAQNALLLDPDAAEAIAKAHIARMNAERRAQASRGATSTMHSAARNQVIEGHTIPDRLADLDVKEEAVVHADDNNMDPDGKDAGEPFKE